MQQSCFAVRNRAEMNKNAEKFSKKTENLATEKFSKIQPVIRQETLLWRHSAYYVNINCQ